jgi:putative addiction module killer protein
MLKIYKSEVFQDWLLSLKDPIAKYRIEARIERLIDGNPGDAKSVGSPVMELRIHHGPGYRVYYVQRGEVVVILLCGGDKSTQSQDIKSAHAIFAHLDLE